MEGENMKKKLKITIRNKAEALLDTWLDDDEDEDPTVLEDEKDLEKEAKETKLGAAPDGKCDPERGDFACYMSDSEAKPSQIKPKPLTKTKPAVRQTQKKRKTLKTKEKTCGAG
jgi:hypothetical protein